MNLRAKKENINPTNVLKDKTNVRKLAENKGKPLKRADTTKILKENNASLPVKARKTQGTQKKKKTLPEVPEPSSPEIVAAAAPTKQTDCFGFSDEEELLAPIPVYNGTLTSFDCSKPYRLSLYVRPARSVRYDPKVVHKVQNWSTMNLSSIPLNTTNMHGGNIPPRKRMACETVMSPDRTMWKVPLSSTPIDSSKVKGNAAKNKPTKTNVVRKAKAMVQRKITDLLPPSPKRTRAGNSKQQFTSFFDKSISSSEEEVLATPIKKPSDEVANPELVVEFPKPRLSSRWYEKKKKPEPLAAPEDTRPTDVILEELSKSKIKSKSKKAGREEEEYEKWSATMNSEFSEVDQFEVSVED